MSHLLTQGQIRPFVSFDSLNAQTSKRKNEQMFRSLVVYAKMLGMSWNVQVLFDPSIPTAATDGKSIWLRPLQIGDESDAILIEGLLDHEAGVHCRQTDFALSNTRLDASVPDLVKTLANVFEDIWGERELKKVKPGCARSISAALGIMVQRGIFGPPKESAHIASMLVGVLVYGLRSRKLGQTMLEPFFLPRWQQLETHFGSQLLTKIWDEAQKVDQCFSTGSAIDLAESVLQILKDFVDQQPPPAQVHQDSSSDTGDNKNDPSPDPNESANAAGQTGDASNEASPDAQKPRHQPVKPFGSSAIDTEPSEGESSEPGTSGSGDAQDSDANPSEDSASDGSSSSGLDDSAHGNAESSQIQARQQGNLSDPHSSNSSSSQQGADKQSRSQISQFPPELPNGIPDNDETSAIANPQSLQNPNPIRSTAQTSNELPYATDNAAPQPAPMTPEEVQNAIRAVMSTIVARQRDSGTGELADALSEALDASDATQKAQSLGISAGNSWQELVSSKVAANATIDAVVSEAARPIALRLGSKLDQILEAQTTSTSYLKRHGRRVHSGRLVSLVTAGNQRIFRASDDVEQIDTVVHVLEDVSASMNAALDSAQSDSVSKEAPTNSGRFSQARSNDKVPQAPQSMTRIGAAAAATRALGDVLNRFDIPFGISYFGSRLTHVKRYEDNWRSKRDVYWTKLESSTCTDQALIGVIPGLAVRPEPRKILVLITDGIPSHPQATALALHEARRLGIDVCVVIVTSNDRTADTTLSAFVAELDKWEISHATAKVVEQLSQAVFDSIKNAL